MLAKRSEFLNLGRGGRTGPRRPAGPGVRGWWRTGALSVALSTTTHLGLGLAAVLVGGILLEEQEAPPTWGILEVAQTSPSTLTESLPPPKRPQLDHDPIPTSRLAWTEHERPQPEIERPRPVEPPPDPPRIERPPPIWREPPAAPEPPSAAASTTSAVPIANPPPRYPASARNRGYQGEVVLLARVSVDGRPIEVSVKFSSGYRILDAAAKRAVLRWRFRPATRGGTPVESEVEVPIRFRLLD